jgi:hypothetical protein
MPDIEGFLAAILRGEHPAWPSGDERFAESFLERAEYHGVLALIHGLLKRDPEAVRDWPPAVLQSCRDSAVGQVMWELRHRALLTETLSQLAAASIRPVLFKGTALAYTLYPEGVLRSRGDTDFIIPPQAQSIVANTLSALGFERGCAVSGESVSYQASFTRTEPSGDAHTLDVHWRINNSELLSRLFTHEELLLHAQAVPALGPDAMAAGTVPALLLACMHRATHKHNPYYVDGVAYYSGDRLIWLYDIHLLVQGFSQQEWDELVHTAQAKGLCTVCLEGLERARTAFHTMLPESVLVALGRAGQTEIVARYFESGPLRQQWMDFCAIPGAAQKLRFVTETLFPPPGYMHQKYPEGGWLLWLYLRRAAGGVLKRLQRAVHPT